VEHRSDGTERGFTLDNRGTINSYQPLEATAMGIPFGGERWRMITNEIQRKKKSRSRSLRGLEEEHGPLSIGYPCPADGMRRRKNTQGERKSCWELGGEGGTTKIYGVSRKRIRAPNGIS